jgi:chemotaxis protein MotB
MNAKLKSGPNHERWLVSYADFITLLFALFVVLYAASNADREKLSQFARAVENAINNSGVGHTRDGQPVKGKAQAPLGPKPSSEPGLDGAYLSLVQSLKPEIVNRQVQVAMSKRGLVITLNQASFFRSGKADYDPSMYPTLGKIAEAIAKLRNPIRLEGHTDSLPIHNERFRSNWELSSARSISTLELLVNRFGLLTSRMAVAGYADNSPVSSNDTEEGRARNRRVDIVVLNMEGVREETGKAP